MSGAQIDFLRLSCEAAKDVPAIEQAQQVREAFLELYREKESHHNHWHKNNSLRAHIEPLLREALPKLICESFWYPNSGLRGGELQSTETTRRQAPGAASESHQSAQMVLTPPAGRQRQRMRWKLLMKANATK
jgi:hypothetical protein